MGCFYSGAAAEECYTPALPRPLSPFATVSVLDLRSSTLGGWEAHLQGHLALRALSHTAAGRLLTAAPAPGRKEPLALSEFPGALADERATGPPAGAVAAGLKRGRLRDHRRGDIGEGSQKSCITDVPAQKRQ